MAEPKTSSSGYGDSDMLRAARELSQSFKKGPAKFKGKAMSEASSPRPDWHQLPRPSYQSTHPPLSNVLPPSQRSYSTQWVPNPTKTASGPIIGKKAMDFLTRQDANANTKSEDQDARGHMDLAAQNSSHEPLNQGSSIQPQGEKAGLPTSPKIPTAADSHPKATLPPESFSMATQALPPLSATLQSSKFSVLTESQGHQPQLKQEKFGNKGILDTFFSLLDEGSEDMPEGLIPSLAPKPPSVLDDTVSQETTKLAGQVLVEHGNGVQSMGMKGTISMQSQSKGKMHDSEAQRDKRLRPEAPGFIPSSEALQDLRNLNTIISPVQSNSIVPANAPEWLRSPRDDDMQSSELLTTGDIVRIGPSFGHLICSTPVQVTNGLITPGSGPTTGTLWLQTPVAVNGAAPVSGQTPITAVSHINPMPGRITSASSSSSGGQYARAQKPTVGLKGSMWA